MEEYIRNVSVCTPDKARKKAVQKDKWKKAIEKVKRYKALGPPDVPICGHNTARYKCSSISKFDISAFHAAFYKTSSKIVQDNFILKHTKAQQPKRRRPKNSCRTPKKISSAFFLRKRNNDLVPVCKQAFLRILGVKKDRVDGVIKRFFDSGEMATEKRGGDRKRKKNENRRSAIQTFMGSLRCTESHYCRSQNSRRLFMPPEMNIRKLFKMYLASIPNESLRVKESFFRKEFCTKYNIGFGTPQTDVCSTCLQLTEKIKSLKNDEARKAQLMAEKTVHKLKAKAFFNSLRDENPENLIMSFDCQKNVLMPKLPDQQAYFSRQYNFYNFTIVVGHSKEKLTTSNVFCYVWNETVRPRSSNEIASAVFHRLMNINLEGRKHIKLFADGCGGQNKNTTLIGMCLKWLHSYAPPNIETIQVIFPVVGHSYIPPDRVFGNIEKALRKKETILSPEEYASVIEHYGTVLKLGEEVPICDWKSATQHVIKPPGQWHFKFNASKRFIMRRSLNNKNNLLVKGETNYRVDLGEFKSVTKKAFSISSITPQQLPSQVIPKADKVVAVSKLLEGHYGEDWRLDEDLRFYCSLELRENIETLEEGDDDLCQPNSETEIILSI